MMTNSSQIVKLRSEVLESKNKIHNYNGETILSLTQGGIKMKDISNNEGQMPENYNNYQKVRKGDFCMNPMDLKTGWVDISIFDGIISPAYLTFSNIGRKLDNDYLKYVLQSKFLNHEYFNLAKGIATHDGAGRWNINIETLLDTKVNAPDLESQKKITRRIDMALSNINKIYEINQNIINKLKILKQSYVNNIIKKIDGKTYKISSLFKIKSVKGHPEKTPLSVFREYGVVKRSDYENKNILPDDLSKYKLVEVGDLVINKMKCWSGSLGISNYSGIVSPAYYTLEKIENFNLDYVNLVLRSNHLVDLYSQISRGVRPAQWDLDLDEFMKIKFVLPDFNHQKSILQKVNKKLLNFDKIQSLQNERLKILENMKKSIIFKYLNN